MPKSSESEQDDPCYKTWIDRGRSAQAGGYEFFASPGGARESGTSNSSGAFDADVVAALRHLAEVIDQRLEFGSLRCE